MFKKSFLYLVIVSILVFSGCIITGKVVDENGVGVPGVTVTLSVDQSRDTTTDSNGKYRFGDLLKDDMIPEGSYTVTPSGSGYNFDPPSRNITITTQTLGDLGDVPWPMTGVDFSVGSNGPAPEDGLVAYYPLDGNANDASGNGNNGIESGGVTYVNGEIGQAASFDGVDDAIVVTGSGVFEPSSITVSLWVKSTLTDNKYVLSKDYLGDRSSYAFYRCGGTFFYKANSTPSGNIITLSPDGGQGIWDNAWHHLVGTYDGNMVRLYVDGDEIGDGFKDPIPPIMYNGGDLHIGHFRFNAFYKGLLDEIRIYNKALSDAEIQTLASRQ